VACGDAVEAGVCAICGETADYCICEPLDETIGDEDEYEEDEDGDEDDYDDYEEDEEEDEDEDDDEDW
jgi:hypothetical protein